MHSTPSTMLKHSVLVAFVATLTLTTVSSHQAPGKVDFRRDVQPLFRQFCIECHGPSQQQQGFRLDRRRDALRGGTTNAIVPGNSATSRLYLKLLDNKYGPQMPLTERLSPEQIEIIKTWIDEGAEWPDELAGDVAPPPPDWFEALNRDFRYQLTVIGQFAQAIIVEEVQRNQLKIATDKPHVKVSWQVTGIRQDKYAKDNRLQVEVDKRPAEQGKCLYAPLCNGARLMTDEPARVEATTDRKP